MLLLCKNCHILQNRSLINNVPNHYQQNLKRSVAYNKKKNTSTQTGVDTQLT